MTRTEFSALAIVFAFGASAALAGPEWKEDEDGGKDAGNVLSTSQNTTGVGPLTAISGRLEGLATGLAGGDLQDAFRIQIDEPTILNITTASGGGFAEFNSRMFLFDGETGAALLGNDDSGTFLGVGSGGTPGGSTLGNMSTDGTGIVITEPGVYMLAICASPDGPLSGGSPMFLIESPTEVSGPDGPAPDDGGLGGWMEEPLGACFFDKFGCEITTEPVCDNMSGSWDEGGDCDSFATGGPANGPAGINYKIVLQGVTFANTERPHPGWNWVDVARDWTANQPAYWSALTGGPGPDGSAVPPFTILDPSADPTQQGRPATDGSGDRVLRGSIYAWAVDEDDKEIAWNHLKGDVTIVNYADGTAWEYNAWAVQAAGDPPAGTPLTQDFVLELDGVEYVPAYSQLLFDFYAPGSPAFGDVGPFQTSVDTHLTLHPITADLRQETTGPYLTKATFIIWNEDETQFTNLHRCVTCWDQQLLSLYTEDGIQNHFLNLQTDKGKARIDGIQSLLCSSDCCMDRGSAAGCDVFECQQQVCQVDPFCCAVQWGPECAAAAVDLCEVCDAINIDAALLGVAGKSISVGVAPLDAAGTNLIGMGLESAAITYESADSGGGQPPTLQLPGPVSALGAGAGRHAAGADTATQSPPVAGADRVSGTEKGSLLIFSKVELRWDTLGNVLQDTFVDLTNDHGSSVRIKMYFINGDAPTP